MSRIPEPLFLARQTYRRRRVADAAQLLPVLGGLLLLLPILALSDGHGATSRGGMYVFAVWAGLILAAALLSRPLSARDPRAGSAADADGAPSDGDRRG